MARSDAREPYCTHTLTGQPHQPASACRFCKDGPELAAWKAYWAAKPQVWVWDKPREDDHRIFGHWEDRRDGATTQ